MNNKKGQEKILKQLQNILSFVWRNKYSDFYRRKYKSTKTRPMQIKSFEDFQKIPFLSRNEIVSTAPSKRLFLPKKESLSIYATSGTTDKPLVMYQKEYKFPKPIMSQLKELRIKKTLVLRPPWIASGNLTSWNKYPASQIVGDLQNLGFTAKISDLAQIDSINASATTCVYFADYLRGEYDLDKIRCLWLGGEYISKEKSNLLKKLYPKADQIIPFVSAETFIRAYQCDFLAGKSPSLYHPVTDFYFEISTSEKVSQEGEGELIVTSLDKETPFPLIRYRTGDLAKIYPEKCRCGQSQTMQVLGRSDYDSIRIQGSTIHRKYLEKAAIKSGLWPTFDYQLHVFEKPTNKKIKVQLELHLAPKSSSGSSEFANTEEFCKQFKITQSMTLSDMIYKDIYLPIKVVKVSGLEKNYKQKLIVSHLS